MSDPWSARQQRHLTVISEYEVADALSRTIINAVHQNLMEPGIDFTAMAATQQNDQEMAAYHTAISGLISKMSSLVQFMPHFSVTSPRVNQGLLYLLLSTEQSLMQFMASLIPLSELPKSYSLTGMCDMTFTSKSVSGQNLQTLPRVQDPKVSIAD